MKRYYLKPVFETILTYIFFTMVMLTLCVDDFVWAWSTLVFAIIWFSTMYIIFRILKKYGKKFQETISELSES